MLLTLLFFLNNVFSLKKTLEMNCVHPNQQNYQLCLALIFNLIKLSCLIHHFEWLKVFTSNSYIIINYNFFDRFKIIFLSNQSKHCLISGQGPIIDIAKNLGFKSVITVEDLRQYNPHLDVVDHKRRNFEVNYFKI